MKLGILSDDDRESHRVVDQLIRGFHPYTGLQLSEFDCCRDPRIIKALQTLLTANQVDSQTTESFDLLRFEPDTPIIPKGVEPRQLLDDQDQAYLVNIREPTAKAKKLRDVKSAKAPKTGTRWTNDEDAQLVLEVSQGHKLASLAKLHARTPLAIAYRLQHLKLELADN